MCVYLKGLPIKPSKDLKSLVLNITMLLIISSLVESIVQLEPRSNKGAASLRDLHDTLKNRIRALEALGEKPMTHSCILLQILETKLSPELSEKWELQCRTNRHQRGKC